MYHASVDGKCVLLYMYKEITFLLEGTLIINMYVDMIAALSHGFGVNDIHNLVVENVTYTGITNGYRTQS